MIAKQRVNIICGQSITSRESLDYLFAVQQPQAFFCANPQVAISGILNDCNGVAGQRSGDSYRSDFAVFNAVQTWPGPYPDGAVFALENTKNIIIKKAKALVVDGKVRVPEAYGPICFCPQPQVSFVVFVKGNNAGFHQAVFGCV